MGTELEAVLAAASAVVNYGGPPGGGEHRTRRVALRHALDAYNEAHPPELPMKPPPLEPEILVGDPFKPDITCAKCGAPMYSGGHTMANCPGPAILQLEKGDVCVLLTDARLSPQDWGALYKRWEALLPGVTIEVMDHGVQILRPTKGDSAT